MSRLPENRYLTLIINRNLKPGGWVDLSEYDMHLFSDDGTFHEGLGLYKFYDLVNQAAAESGSLPLPNYHTPPNDEKKTLT